MSARPVVVPDASPSSISPLPVSPSARAAALGIARARWRAGLRRAREQAFALLVLSPIVLGGLAWIGWRYLDLLREPLADHLAQGGRTAPALLGIALVAALWPATRREVLPAGDDLLDVLPVTEGQRFLVTLLSALGRSVFVALVWLVAVTALGRPLGPEVEGSGLAVLATLEAFATAALVAVFGVLLVGRAGRRTAAIAVGVAFVDLTLSSFGLAPPLGTLAGWALMPFVALGELALQAPRVALGLGIGDAVGPWSFADLVIACFAVALARWLFVGRRRLDPSTAGRLYGKLAKRERPVDRQRAPSRERSISRSASSPAATLVRRDLRLIRRGFSPAAGVAAILSLWVLALTALVALDGAVAPEWRLRAGIGGGALAVLALEAIVPFLIAHQLPRLWIERSIGVDLDTIWRAKLRLAALLALGPTAIAGLLIWRIPGSLGERFGALGLLFAAAAVGAALIGLASFEIAEQPLVGYLFAGSAALAIAVLLAAYPAGWWLWLALAGALLSMASDRASARLRRMEVAS